MRHFLLFFRVTKVVTQDLEVVVTSRVLEGDISQDSLTAQNVTALPKKFKDGFSRCKNDVSIYAEERGLSSRNRL